MEDKTSMKLGPYQLVRRLARGGMSEVYLVSDERDEQVYALKMARQQDEEECLRFQQEVQVLMGLKHPHILPILDAGLQEEICYYVMPYIANGTIKDRLKRGPLSEQEVEVILTQVADALQFLHEAGFVHRDVKPSNILQEETNQVWLADFGLVRSIEGGSDLTRTGYLLGTPAYMAPELEKTPASANSDVYALGVVLYEMLTGHVPFTGETLLEIYLKQVFEQPPSPSTINPLVSPAIEQVVLRALEKHPADRYRSAQALTEAYQQALLMKPGDVSTGNHLGASGTGTLPLTPLPEIGSQTQRRARRTPLAVGALTAMALLTLGLVSIGVASHGGLSLISNSPAQVPAVHAADISPTRTSPHSRITPVSASSTPSGSAPAGATTPTVGGTPSSSPTPPAEPSATSGSTPPAEPSATSGSTPPAEPSATSGSTPPVGTTPTPSVTPAPSASPVSTPTPSGKPKKKPHKP